MREPTMGQAARLLLLGLALGALASRVHGAGAVQPALGEPDKARATAATETPGLPGAIVPAPDVEMAAVIERARAREARARTVQCTYVVDVRYPARDLRDVEPDYRASGATQAGKEHDLRSTVRLIFDGEDASARLEDWCWFPEEGAYHECEDLEVVAGGRSFQLSPSTGVGRVSGRPELRAVAVFCPPLLAYRLFDPLLGRADAQTAVVEGRSEYRGHPCIVVRQSPGRGSRWWLAEDQEYCPVLCESFGGQTLSSRMEMHYVRDPDAGWRLETADWTWEAIPGSVPKPTRWHLRVTSTEINRPVDRSAFSLAFPPGTRVNDEFLEIVYTAQDADAMPDMVSSVTGTVIDEGGIPAPGAQVYAVAFASHFDGEAVEYRKGVGGVRSETRADAAGRFAIAGVPRGHVILGAFAREGLRWGRTTADAGDTGARVVITNPGRADR